MEGSIKMNPLKKNDDRAQSEALLTKNQEKFDNGVQLAGSEAPEPGYKRRRDQFKRARSVPDDRTPFKRSIRMKRVFSLDVESSPTVMALRKISEGTFSSVGPADENQERGNWTNPIEFLLSGLGYAVGLGNVWRFPYLVFRNGGGAFLIPYVIMLLLAGLPLMFIELVIGQYSSQGPLTVWNLSPLFKGIGISMVLMSVVSNVYYNVITGWALYYLAMSLRAVLPWACCESPWAGPDCISFVQNTSICSDRPAAIQWGNGTELKEWSNSSKFAADEYFHNQALAISDSIDEVGGIHWPVLVSLVAAWIIVFLVLMKGIKSFGKTVYFTSVFPYFVLLALLIRACIEPGAGKGVSFYLTPRWELLAEPQVWTDAASQIFFSSGVCFGGVITLASYNNFKNNILHDVIFIAIGNSLTSIFSGFVVFSILGFMAESQNTTIEAVVTEGPGLTFIAYPQAVTLLSVAPLWSSLFFFMLSTLALSSMFPTTESIISAVVDQFSETLRPFKFWITLLTCVLSCVAGFLLCTNGGMYILELLNTYAVGCSLLFLGIIEIVVLAWRYGARKVVRNIEEMLGTTKSLVVWLPLWLFITPLLLIFSIIFSIVKSKPIKYGGEVYPPWTVPVGWTLCTLTVLPVPLFAALKLISFKRSKEGREMSLWESLKFLTAPSKKWGPAHKR